MAPWILMVSGNGSRQVFPGVTETASPATYGKPAPRQVVAKREDQEVRQPDHPSPCNDPGEVTTVTQMHEEEHHQQGLTDGDAKGEDEIQGPKVEKGHAHGEKRKRKQDPIDPVINMTRHDRLHY